MKKVRERNVDLHLHFIDFKAALDTVWRNTLWKMIRAINIDEKIVNRPVQSQSRRVARVSSVPDTLQHIFLIY